MRSEESYVKTEVLELVKQNVHTFKKFVTDDTAEKSGNAVQRLPPYHCIVNPIELIWSLLKRYIAYVPIQHMSCLISTIDKEGGKWNNCRQLHFVEYVINEDKVWLLS